MERRLPPSCSGAVTRSQGELSQNSASVGTGSLGLSAVHSHCLTVSLPSEATSGWSPTTDDVARGERVLYCFKRSSDSRLETATIAFPIKDVSSSIQRA